MKNNEYRISVKETALSAFPAAGIWVCPMEELKLVTEFYQLRHMLFEPLRSYLKFFLKSSSMCISKYATYLII